MWWVRLVVDDGEDGPVIRVEAPAQEQLRAAEVAECYFRAAWWWLWDRRQRTRPFRMVWFHEDYSGPVRV